MGQGKEAVTVRQALLVIVLIGSSFLGGAFVNGPGLRWAQTRLMRSLGLNEEAEIASVDLTASVAPGGVSDGSESARPTGGPMLEPLAPTPSTRPRLRLRFFHIVFLERWGSLCHRPRFSVGDRWLPGLSGSRRLCLG